MRSGFVVELEGARRRRKTRLARVPRVVEMLARAVELGRLLESGAVRFRVDLARRSGVSAMRISQIMAMLKLAPEIQEFVRGLPPGTPERQVTERRLRLLSGLSPAEQIKRARVDVPGFGAHVVQRGEAMARGRSRLRRGA